MFSRPIAVVQYQVLFLIILGMNTGAAFAQRSRPVERRNRESPTPAGPRSGNEGDLPNWFYEIVLGVVIIGALIGLIYWIRLAIRSSKARQKLFLTLALCSLGAYLLCAIVYLSPGLAVLAVCGPLVLLKLWMIWQEKKKSKQGTDSETNPK